MGRFANVVRRIGGVGVALGSVSLIGIMALVVANITVRLFGPAIVGTYELIELMMVVTIAVALSYCALRQGHVTVKLLMSRLSPRAQAILGSITAIMSLGVWAVMAVASIEIAREKMLAGEVTEVLRVACFPFRYVWVLGLILFCLVLLIDLPKTLSQAVKK